MEILISISAIKECIYDNIKANRYINICARIDSVIATRLVLL